MINDTNKNSASKMLSRSGGTTSLDLPPTKKSRVNKRLRYCADPIIHRTKRKRGSTYYTFRRGENQEIYLGTAEFILKAVTFYKQEQGKKHPVKTRVENKPS